jgi:protein CpxP
MKKRIIAILAISILVVGAVFVVAQKAVNHGFGGHGRGFGRGHGMMLQALNLTDDQKAKVKAIMETNRTNLKPVFDSLRENHQKLEALTANGAFDEGQVSALATEQGNLMAKMTVERARIRSQIAGILTDEQKAKAAQMREQFKQKMQERFKARQTEKAPSDSE